MKNSFLFSLILIIFPELLKGSNFKTDISNAEHSSSINSLAAPANKRLNNLNLSSVDHLYLDIKNNTSVEKLTEKLEGVDLNIPFSSKIEEFGGTVEAEGLTLLQLAVLCNHKNIVRHLLTYPNVQINESAHLRATLDLCDFYNIIPPAKKTDTNEMSEEDRKKIIDDAFKERVHIRNMLIACGALYGKIKKEKLDISSIYSMTLRTLHV